MLDAFDAMLYALVLAHVMRDLGMSKGTAGLLNSLTLVASGIGGVAFGFIADRVGRNDDELRQPELLAGRRRLIVRPVPPGRGRVHFSAHGAAFPSCALVAQNNARPRLSPLHLAGTTLTRRAPGMKKDHELRAAPGPGNAGRRRTQKSAWPAEMVYWKLPFMLTRRRS